jgi:hypothetical protein
MGWSAWRFCSSHLDHATDERSLAITKQELQPRRPGKPNPYLAFKPDAEAAQDAGVATSACLTATGTSTGIIPIVHLESKAKDIVAAERPEKPNPYSAATMPSELGLECCDQFSPSIEGLATFSQQAGRTCFERWNNHRNSTRIIPMSDDEWKPSFFDFLLTKNWSVWQAFVCQHMHGWSDSTRFQPRTGCQHRDCKVCGRAFFF